MRRDARRPAAPPARAERGVGDDGARPPSTAPTRRLETGVEDVRGRLTSNLFLFSRLGQAAVRRLGVAPMTVPAIVIAGAVGGGTRLLVALALTAAFGQWSAVPWVPWAVVVVYLGLGDAFASRQHGAPHQTTRPGSAGMMEAGTALVARIVREPDVRQLAAFMDRWYRLPVSASVAILVALAILGPCALVAPSALRELPVGTLALLAFLVYDVGEVVFWNLFCVPFMAREAAFDHELFWRSPVDSIEVRTAMRTWATMQFIVGTGITLSLVVTIVLVGLDSALTPPLAAGLVAWGYITTVGMALSVRGAIARIVGRIRDRNLAEVQARLDTYRSRFADLPPEDAERVERLIAIHDAIRDAPTSPRTSEALLQTLIALVIPTVLFVITVFGEVIAERFLDQLLP